MIQPSLYLSVVITLNKWVCVPSERSTFTSIHTECRRAKVLIPSEEE